MGIGQLTRIARNLFRFDVELIKQEAIEQDRAFITYYVVELANTNSSSGRASIGVQFAELDRVPSRLL